jgi:3',5'-cyclic AMP phosphodiesterase CpdA
MALKIAHISDIHFFHMNKSPLQFFCKRFLANFHAFFTRRTALNPNLAYKVLPLLKKEGVTHIIISGDFTSSSSVREFQLMKNYITAVKASGFEVLTLPGNHDAYTKEAYRNQSFFTYLSNLVNFSGETGHNLIDHRTAAYKLTGPWWAVLINCSQPTPWHKSTGVFSKEVEESLLSTLEALPKNSEITLICHYPFERFRYPKAHLERGEKLEAIIKNDKRIRLYLHGHRHLQRVEQVAGITVADSGSISLKKRSTFNILNFDKTSCEITQYKYMNHTWTPTDDREKISSLV